MSPCSNPREKDPSLVSRVKFEFVVLQDSWTLRMRLYVETGFRRDTYWQPGSAAVQAVGKIVLPLQWMFPPKSAAWIFYETWFCGGRGEVGSTQQVCLCYQMYNYIYVYNTKNTYRYTRVAWCINTYIMYILKGILWSYMFSYRINF